MHIQSHKKIEFTDESHPKSSPEVFTTKGGGAVEVAPDWLKTNEYFLLNKADGSVIVLGEDVPAVPIVPVLKVPEAPVSDTSEDNEPGVDDGTYDVRSLAAKLGLNIGQTVALLKNTHGFEAKNGSALLDQALFEQVVDEAERLKAGG